MARSRRKNGGPTRGRVRLKKLGKGYSTVRKEASGSRPVLRITEPVAASGTKQPKAKAKG
ncbi:MAG: hypothetical protein JNM25_14740 [Planctomycetes bacterium]|nr:hypothetical protein [Planctomycetota bacterium]